MDTPQTTLSLEAETQGHAPASIEPELHRVSAAAVRILLVEDTAPDAEIVHAAVQRGLASFEWVHAATWDLFLRALADAPGVVLTDFYLDGFTARDVIRELKERGIDCPVIVVSGSVGEEAAAECIRSGAADFVAKTQLRLLPASLRRAIENHRLRQAQRAAVAELRRSDGLLRMASRVGHFGAWTVELPDRVVTWSDEVRAIHEVPEGFAPDVELAIAFYVPASQPVIRAAVEACTRTGTEFDLELELITAKERRIWVRAIGEAVRDEHGAICRLQGAVQDISRQKRAELAVRHTAEQLTATLESITDAFFTVDRDWRFTYVNREAESLLRRPREQLLGRMIWDEFPEARGSAFHQNYERALRDNVSVQFEAYYAPIDLWADVRAYPSPQGLAVYFRDNTQTRRIAQVLRESEERYRLLFDENPHPIWVQDVSSSRILAANNRMLEFYGYGREELLRMSPDQLHAPTEPAADEALGSTPFDAAVRHVLRDGRVVWVQLTSHDIELDRRPARLVIAQDVTARRAAELALRESERRFRELAENLEDVFYNYDVATGSALYVSPAYEKVWGRPCEPLYDAPYAFTEAIHADDRATFARAHAENLQGKPTDITYRIVRPDGETRWVRDRAFTLPKNHDRVERIVGVARDVTEQQRAEEVLRQSEERFRLLIEGVTDYAIMLLDCAGCIASWNHGAERIFGYSAAEAIGRQDSCLFADDARATDVPWTLLEEAVSAGSAKAEGWRLRKDGSRFWALVVVTALRGETGELRGFSKITRDISERRAAEEKLAQQAALLDQASDAILVRDMNHVVEFWSKGAERLYGWLGAEARGVAVTSLLYASTESFDVAMQALLRDGSWSGELEQRTKDGRALTVCGRWTLLRDSDGQPRSVLVINTDITERKKKDAQFYRAQRMESIGTLAGGIAHDLNNLLAPITMGVEILRTVPLSEDDARIVWAIQRSAERGTNLVRQILSFARGLESDRVVLNVRHVVNEVQMIMADTFPKNITLDVEIARDTWTVTGDLTQLVQVLLNLCVNARDAMSAGGRLAIAVGNQAIDDQFASGVHGATPGNYVVVSVKDTGCGIPRELMDHIFDPFFTTKGVGKGTGLGLATALGITKDHGGFLTVHSELGQGSEFRVHLPAALHVQAPLTAPMPECELPPGSGEWILVVDDEPAIRTTTKQTLERFGYNVLLAEDGAEAIAVFARQSDRVVLTLTDLAMPVMDGVSLVAALRRIRADALVIGATGAASEQDLERFRLAGVNRLIRKPFLASSLLGAMRTVLEEPRCNAA